MEGVAWSTDTAGVVAVAVQLLPSVTVTVNPPDAAGIAVVFWAVLLVIVPEPDHK